MTDPKDVQHGGNHYKNFPVQPIEFTTANLYDPSAHSVLKYLIRHGSKGGFLDLQKAAHFADLRVEILDPAARYALQDARKKYPAKIGMHYFLHINQIPAVERSALVALHDWVCNTNVSAVENSKDYARTKAAIQAVATARYGLAL